MDRRSLIQPGAVRLEQRAEDEEPRIVGVAAVYYDGTERTEFQLWSGAVERIAPGALARAAREDDVRALFNHDPNLPLARTKSGTLRLESLADGLHFETEPADTSIYRDVRELLRRGDVDGSSFAFRVLSERWTWDEEREVEVRTIEDVTLYDVGPVAFPAYEATSAGVRIAEQVGEARASYERHREILERQRRRRRVNFLMASRFRLG